MTTTTTDRVENPTDGPGPPTALAGRPTAARPPMSGS